MFHALTVFFGMVMWTFILVMLAPMVYRFAMRHQDAVKDGLRTVRRMFGR